MISLASVIKNNFLVNSLNLIITILIIALVCLIIKVVLENKK